MLRAISVIPQNAPKRKPVPPSRFLQLHSGRQREERCCHGPGFLSFLSNGLEMYYYANVNFDTEFKKRLLDFFLFSKKKKRSHMWSSLLLYFVTWIVTMHSAEGGRRGQKGEGSSFASLFYGFCVHGIPTSWRGRGVRSRSDKVGTVRCRDLWVLPRSLAGLMAWQFLGARSSY